MPVASAAMANDAPPLEIPTKASPAPLAAAAADRRRRRDRRDRRRRSSSSCRASPTTATSGASSRRSPGRDCSRSPSPRSSNLRHVRAALAGGAARASAFARRSSSPRPRPRRPTSPRAARRRAWPSPFAMLRGWGFSGRPVALAVTLTGVWNQLVIFGFPPIALGLLTAEGGGNPLLQTMALVGAAVLGGVDRRPRRRLLERAARAEGRRPRRAARVVAQAPRSATARSAGTASRSCASGDETIGLLRRRWHVITLATLAGHLSVFAVLLVSLRVLDVPASEVDLDRGVRRLVDRARASARSRSRRAASASSSSA